MSAELRGQFFARLLVAIAVLAGQGGITTLQADRATSFVRVSPHDSRYFELSDGSPYIPVGLNMIAPAHHHSAQSGLADIERWMERLSANGGNFARIWLSHRFWDVEHRESGNYDQDKAERIDALLAIARKYGLRVKLTIEHFRTFDEGVWSGKPLHHVSNGGCAETVTDFFDRPACRRQFKRKIGWYADRYGNNPTVFAWELWNEVNAVRGTGWDKWTREMLAELHARFPKNLATQSLGSFDVDHVRPNYRMISAMAANDIAQVHRYLDLGARLDVCHGPVDVLAADAVAELKAFTVNKPILLAESGAVEPRHTGPFKLYARDRAGIILHDVLFAPFFAGAAGTGQIWHWDKYVDRNDLWWQFGRFAEATAGVDPAAEHFQCVRLDNRRLRIYVLKGDRTVLAWCRDRHNTWKSELAEGKEPQVIRQMRVDCSDILTRQMQNISIEAYNPWTNDRSQLKMHEETITLPDFSRSVVIRIQRPPQ